MLKIGTVILDNWLSMAPMAGVTTLPFRLMVKGLGAGLVFTEMVSSVGIKLKKPKTMSYLKSHPTEKPLGAQIFGSEPDIMAFAAQKAVDSGSDLVDINMGCPVKKVTKTGAGSALLKDLKRVAEIVTAVRMACNVPLTVKIRAGWSPEEEIVSDVAHIIEDCGADAIIVHPRFRTQMFSGHSDWNLIGRVKQQVQIPVIGNGDIVKPSDAISMRTQTGCDGVMIGRAAVGNPWIFKQILQLEEGLPVEEPSIGERKSLIIEHFRLLSNSVGEYSAALSMRGLLLRYTKGLPNSNRFRERITRIKDSESLLSTMNDYFTVLEEKEH